ncbi:hypothetical protein GCM10027515_01170 [Schumannella luteola]|uniref:DUF3558 domain-containing protein n=1 Tax=Schumannella luteola TaxID=472059 RepID=A0A852Y8K9_9MICO|nr:hypothetical protein [Schumannella luteola]NYG98743.1 hypothetical protein [Schumannella luteola]TPX04326.1 hypothetical protein FJ656_12760 [Schumannella luteola]
MPSARAALAAVASVALVLVLAACDTAAAPPSPRASVTPSATASPAAAAKPASRIRIGCESVLSLTEARAYLGDSAKPQPVRADTLSTAAFVQAGGLACDWGFSDVDYLRLRVLPIDVDPAGLGSSFWGDRTADAASGARWDDFGVTSRIWCSGVESAGGGCMIDVVGAKLHVEMTTGTSRQGDQIVDQQAVVDHLGAAIGRVLDSAAPRPAWTPPYPVDDAATDCAAVDPDGALTSGFPVRGTPDGIPMPTNFGSTLEQIALTVSGAVACSFLDEEGRGVQLNGLIGSRWAWDAVRSRATAEGGRPLELRGAEDVIETCGSGGGYRTCTITLLHGGSVYEFSADEADEAAMRAGVERWLASRSS